MLSQEEMVMLSAKIVGRLPRSALDAIELLQIGVMLQKAQDASSVAFDVAKVKAGLRLVEVNTRGGKAPMGSYPLPQEFRLTEEEEHELDTEFPSDDTASDETGPFEY